MADPNYPRYYRNDTDGSLKAAALRAAVEVDCENSIDGIPETAKTFYEWLRESN